MKLENLVKDNYRTIGKYVRNAVLSVGAAALVASCTNGYTPVPVDPTLTKTKEVATATYTPEPSATATLAPELYSLEGVVFFDYNGSGLQDVAYNMDGEAMQEPGIEGVPVCIDTDPKSLSLAEIANEENCVFTAADGSYLFEGIEPGYVKIHLKSPTDEPATAFRYINLWKGPVVIDEYTKDIDVATMQTLVALNTCTDGLDDFVCKLDEDTLLVREQNLNDTEIKDIEDPLSVRIINEDLEKNLGLMQGFLTLPFVQKQVGEMPFVFNYFDIIGNRLLNDEVGYFDTQDGVMMSYDGSYNRIFPGEKVINGELIAGVGDSHTGNDFFVHQGNIIVSGAPTSKVFFLSGPPTEPELRVHIGFEGDIMGGFLNATTYGHLNVQLVKNEQKIYRGQILGLSGNTGYDSWYGAIPELHFDFATLSNKGWSYYDPYRYLINPEEFSSYSLWGSEESLWTKDNNPIFPK